MQVPVIGRIDVSSTPDRFTPGGGGMVQVKNEGSAVVYISADDSLTVPMDKGGAWILEPGESVTVPDWNYGMGGPPIVAFTNGSDTSTIAYIATK